MPVKHTPTQEGHKGYKGSSTEFKIEPKDKEDEWEIIDEKLNRIMNICGI